MIHRAFWIVAVLVAAACAPAQESRFHTDRPNPKLLPLPKEEGVFAFVVYGDRTQGVPAGLKILEQAVADTNLLAPDLVMTVGDLVQGYNDTQAWVAEARDYKSVMNKLAMPWFPVSGNHDIYFRGKNAPKNHHESNFEEHFGPLWYAFQHKNAWFIVLHSDEGNPDTGRRDFNDPGAQKMSAAQFSWLTETLARTKGADHVFAFLHHPRWNKGGYGDDWDRVHDLMARAGNVSAVFAGHIHRMKWDGKKDGIEYFTLAGTGASLPAEVPGAGFLHEFHVVTVRKGKFDVATIPVGAVMDPRSITAEVSDDVLALTQRLTPVTTKKVELTATWACDGLCEVEIQNPIGRPIEVLCTPECGDVGFRFSPDHQHVIIPGGEKRAVTFLARRAAAPLSDAFGGLDVSVQCDYLGNGIRVSLPRERFAFGVTLPLLPEAAGDANGAVSLDGVAACLRVASGALDLPDGPFTVEAWMRATDFTGRRGLINKTELSEFGIFVSDGKPGFSVFAGEKYANASATDALLQANRWHHVAGTFDGQEARLYVDGKIAARAAGSGARKRNTHALFVGADPDSVGKPGSFFQGEIDEVRISKVARYRGDAFEPARRFVADGDTVMLLHLDRNVGPWVLDASPMRTHADRVARATCVEVRE